MAHYAKLGQPDPEASNVTYQQWHPRELDESELWLAWDRPDSGIPDAHMECVSLIVIAYLSKALLTIVNRYLRTPAIYSDKRCVYELLPSGVVQVVHSLRQHCWSKLSIYEIVFDTITRITLENCTLRRIIGGFRHLSSHSLLATVLIGQ